MKVEFDVNLKPDDIFNFNFYQIYRGMQGVVSLVLSAFVFAMGFVRYEEVGLPQTILTFAIGILFLVYIPCSLKLRSKTSFEKNEVLSKPLHFTMTEKCIEVTQGEDSGQLPWDRIYKMITTKKYLYIYSARIYAYIVPLDQIENQYDKIKELATKQLETYRIKMK